MFSRIISSVGEALAPPVRTPLEEFKSCWKDLNDLYQGKKAEKERDKIESIVHNMVRLLSLEVDSNDEPVHWMCLEYMLEAGVLDSLCEVAMNDKPVGMRGIVMIALSSLFRNMPVSIMYQVGIHRPLVDLLLGSMEMEKVDMDALSVFVMTLSKKVGENTTLIDFFMADTVGEKDNKRRLFLPLEVLQMQLLKSTKDGKRAREAFLSALAYTGKYESVCAYMMNELQFPLVFSRSISSFFVCCTETYGDKKTMKHLIDQLVFISGCMEVVREEMRQQIEISLEKEFYGAIRETMRASDDQTVQRAYLAGINMFRKVSNPLRRKLVSWFLADEIYVIRISNLNFERNFDLNVRLMSVIADVEDGSGVQQWMAGALPAPSADLERSAYALLDLYPTPYAPPEDLLPYLVAANRRVKVRKNAYFPVATGIPDRAPVIEAVLSQLEDVTRLPIPSLLALLHFITCLCSYKAVASLLLGSNGCIFLRVQAISKALERACKAFSDGDERTIRLVKELWVDQDKEKLPFEASVVETAQKAVILSEFCKDLAATLICLSRSQ